MDELVTQSTFEAAKSGDVEAKVLIGESYLYGKNGLKQSWLEAFQFLHMAWKVYGSSKACLLIIHSYEKGIGREANLVEAYWWALQAKSLKAPDADQVVARIKQQLWEGREQGGDVVEAPKEPERKKPPLSHAKMAKWIRRGSYSTFRNVYGAMDDRPVIFPGRALPVAYVQYVPMEGGGRRTYAVWPEGDIQGYLENAKPGDMLIFPGWRDIQRWQQDDKVFDYTNEGWVPHVDLGYR